MIMSIVVENPFDAINDTLDGSRIYFQMFRFLEYTHFILFFHGVSLVSYNL